MNAAAENFLRFDPGFVESAVFFAVHDRPEERIYQRERSRIYGIVDSEQREAAFHDFDARWFTRLSLPLPIEQAFAEAPTILASLGHCLIAGAPEKKLEGAELFVPPDTKLEKPAACILLRPESLLDAERLLAFLRHELLHLSDMLDPGFAYEPALPAAEGGPTHDRLLKDRYRVLWDATIDGRMVRRGWLAAAARAERLEEFARAFPMLGAATNNLFESFFDGDGHTHGELVAFATHRPNGFEDRPAPGSRCPLCGFPTYDFEAKAENLPENVIAAIAGDFPSWRPSRGLCAQCADLYRAREMSLRAARELPGLR
jgi:hypothetical protein